MRTHVKYVPFKCSSPSVMDFAHFPDKSSRDFAIGLSKSRTVAESEFYPVGGGNSDGEGGGGKSRAGADAASSSGAAASRSRGLSGPSKEELAAYAASECIAPEEICRKEACMVTLHRLLRSDEFQRAERVRLSAELAEVQAEFGEVQEVEAELLARLVDVAGEVGRGLGLGLGLGLWVGVRVGARARSRARVRFVEGGVLRPNLPSISPPSNIH